MPAIHDPVAQSGRTPLQRPLSCSQHNHSQTSRPWQIRCPVPVQPPGKSHAPALHAGKSHAPALHTGKSYAPALHAGKSLPPIVQLQPSTQHGQIPTGSRTRSARIMTSSLQTAAPAQCAAWTAPYRQPHPLRAHCGQLLTESSFRSARIMTSSL